MAHLVTRPTWCQDTVDHYEHYGRTQEIAQYVLHLSWSFLQAALLRFNRHGKSGRETESTEQSGPGEIP